MFTVILMNNNGVSGCEIYSNVNIPLPNPKNTKDKYILIVEDNEINMKVITSMLKLMRYKYIEAHDGRQALEILNEHKVDLVLMDVQMPIIDGFKTTKMIREKGKLSEKHTTIVAMTAYAMHGDKELCIEMGMDDYISKPLYFTVLKELLVKYL